MMQGVHILTLLIVGILAGWLAGLITKGSGFGFLVNMVLGIVGAFIGTYLLGYFNIVTAGFLGLLIAAILGAVILLVIVGLIRKATR